MLDRLTLTDYRGFAKIDVELKPLTVLIGRNGTGKSDFLCAIRTEAYERSTSSHWAVLSRGAPISNTPAWINTGGFVLLVEHPECGVHPKAQKGVMDFYRELTTRTLPIQVIMTTHSPYLLDYVNLETDQVLVFRADKDGNCFVDPVDRERVAPFLEEFTLAGFMLGEVWFNRGENKLVSKDAQIGGD